MPSWGELALDHPSRPGFFPGFFPATSGIRSASAGRGKTGSRSRPGQGVVGALAELAGDAGAVSRDRQPVSALCKAAEHVGKQIGSVAGWRAASGSGGADGGATGSGDKKGLLAQAVSSSTGSNSVALRRLPGTEFSILTLLQPLHAA